MKYPNFHEEKKLYKKGYKCVVGLDEAGRGPLAGPVVAAAFCFRSGGGPTSAKLAEVGPPLLLRDSKKLTPGKREYFFKTLTKDPNIKWGTGKVSEKIIDKINILEATKLAMQRAINSLEKRLGQKIDDRLDFTRGCFLIIDGNFAINSKIPQKSIIKADEKVFSCAAASIIAKVTRDRIMTRYHKKYPQYFFDKNKGYPTKLHKNLIKKYGFCQIHRKSFKIS